ncbi:hypothetical protein KEM44_22610 [Sinorhizobium meliloti]|nr:hypothetical protein [Sinorhizobium meliloti]ASJ59267.1 hypothetical protein SMB554_08700 [Sinorhizobium meliloti]MCK3783197.1 hypothetical protein [Sinorhizobium meliloti]MCK3788173.1 hypothetical protein [Sinorhizobium meliloti]MCK3794550.1 hypothetical protein [Sinorhizobium meliloti]UTG98843.1 hypothetical protein KEM44_22610 [Sinorhizobium meliloti]
MQAAAIWFQMSATPLTLLQVNEYLQEMGAEVKETEWRLGDVVVPQLQVTSPVMFLVQLEDEEWVIEEAEELSHLAPLEVRAKLSICDARLAFGDADDESATTTDQGIFVLAGWTGFDPANPQVRILLEGLARIVDGIVNDKTSGTYWVPS